MPVAVWQNLTAVENNDITYTFDLASNNAPFNVTNYTLDLVLKPSQTSLDSAGTTFTTSSGLTVVSAPLGVVTWSLAHTYTGTPGTQWYRLDAIDASSNRTTFFLGNLTVMAA